MSSELLLDHVTEENKKRKIHAAAAVKKRREYANAHYAE
jgi:hypothetical protein